MFSKLATILKETEANQVFSVTENPNFLFLPGPHNPQNPQTGDQLVKTGSKRTVPVSNSLSWVCAPALSSHGDSLMPNMSYICILIFPLGERIFFISHLIFQELHMNSVSLKSLSFCQPWLKFGH